MNNICMFFRQEISSKFRNTGKLIPFVFKGVNMSLKMREKVGYHFGLAINSK